MPNKNRLELTFDDPVPEDRAQILVENQAGVTGMWMTRNEARKRMGFDPIPGGDVFLMPITIQEIPANVAGKKGQETRKSYPLFQSEAQCEAYWTDYVKRAGAYENKAIFALETLFQEQEKEALANLEKLKSWKGGEGSGNFDHEGRPGEVGGSGTGGGGGTSEIVSNLTPRAQRARSSYKVSSQSVQRQAEGNEPKLANSIGGKTNSNNQAFDVVKGNNVVEVKTIVRGSNDKITMHPESLARKEAFVKQNGVTSHTVVFDDRNNKIYYKQGLGSFRLRNMQEVSLSSLQGIIKRL